LRYALQPIAIVDLLAILPFFFPITGLDLRIIRAVRLVRVFRILKLGRYSDSVGLIVRVLKKEKEDLGVILFAGMIILVISSALIFFFENPHQPNAFPSIPAAMWWGIATLTTVGNTDIHPITLGGRVFGAAIAIIGVILVALPTGILASAFAKEMDRESGTRRCPHCGREIETESNG
jgi:voltage-gated potassium channel